jgi:hypothetical protein
MNPLYSVTGKEYDELSNNQLLKDALALWNELLLLSGNVSIMHK